METQTIHILSVNVNETNGAILYKTAIETHVEKERGRQTDG